MNKLLEWIDAELAKITTDERYRAKTALVQVNAPLALIQVALKARWQALQDARAFIIQSEK